MQRAMWVGMTASMLMTGCQQVQCGAPTAAVYACEPVPVGSGGCGEDPGEIFGSPAGLISGGGEAPVGCEVTLPYCHPFYPDQPARCRCVQRTVSTDVDAGPFRPDAAPSSNGATWLCPL